MRWLPGAPRKHWGSCYDFFHGRAYIVRMDPVTLYGAELDWTGLDWK